MKNIKIILKSSKEIVITYILNNLIIIILALTYTLLGYTNLELFLNTTVSYIVLIFTILTIIYLYFHNPKQEPKLPLKKYFPLIHLGISLAITLNMIIFLIYPPSTSLTISLPLIIISSGIIGPIYEEILFRYLLYNRLKKNYSIQKSSIITTMVFALSHIYPIKIIYAFILGLFINIVYEKHHNILAPILVHIAANTIVIFLHEYNTYILILSLINLLISIKNIGVLTSC